MRDPLDAPRSAEAQHRHRGVQAQVRAGTDWEGTPYVVTISLGDATIYLERDGLPTRRVNLSQLIEAILRAESVVGKATLT